MDRLEWIKEKRRLTRERYDYLFASTYDEQWGSIISPTHESCFNRFLDVCPPHALILDAACGTGKYWSLILASDRKVVGIDQSQAMLNCAHSKFPDVHIEKVGLQEMYYHEAFDGACCMDAMEFVFPEDWPLVLNSLNHAIRSTSPLYLTVEIAEEKEIEHAFLAGQLARLPVVYGEWAHEVGYHYYPKIEQVREWVQQAGFRLIEEMVGDDYHHFLVQKQS
jgi:SAM-dependent methyltransferase